MTRAIASRRGGMDGRRASDGRLLRGMIAMTMTWICKILYRMQSVTVATTTTGNGFRMTKPCTSLTKRSYDAAVIESRRPLEVCDQRREVRWWIAITEKKRRSLPSFSPNHAHSISNFIKHSDLLLLTQEASPSTMSQAHANGPAGHTSAPPKAAQAGGKAFSNAAKKWVEATACHV